MSIYRQSDLSSGTIAVVQNIKKEHFLDESIKWLKSKIFNDNKNIKHSLSSGKSSYSIRVDGYNETENKCISIIDVSGTVVRNASTLMI